MSLRATAGAIAIALLSTPAQSESTYSVSVSSATAEVGKEGSVAVIVTAGEGYQCNEDYPHRIVDIDAGAAVRAPKTVKGGRAEKTITYAIPVTPIHPGAHQLSGEIRFQICNSRGCELKKVPLEATVTGIPRE